jgi:hypothetical protein
VKAEEEVVAILLGLVRCFGRKVRVGCGVAVSRMDEVTNVRLGAAMKSIQLLKALLSIYKNSNSMARTSQVKDFRHELKGNDLTGKPRSGKSKLAPRIQAAIIT